MTKDVIISISGSHIDVAGELMDGEEDGTIEVITTANYFERDDKRYIFYDEYAEDSALAIKNRITITGNQMLEIQKAGHLSAHMIFEEGQSNQTYYETPFGRMLVGVTTLKMEVKEESDYLQVRVAYELDVDNQPFADSQILIEVNSKQ